MIAQAPATFVAAVAIVGTAAFLVASWAYSAIVAHHLARIASLEERLKLRDDQLADKVQNTPPEEAQKLIEALQAQLDGLKPRRIVEPQKTTLSRAAVGRGGDAYTLSILNDVSSPDGGAYASDLAAALSNLQGWKIERGSVMGPARTSQCGLALYVGDPTNLTKPERIVFDVLHAAGVLFEAVPLKNRNGDVTLMISTKLT